MNDAVNRAWLITPFAPSQSAIPYSNITENDCIIAVDGGLKRCLELNLIPNLLIGDMDSLPADSLENLPSGCEKIIHPAHKDETDTQLATQYCIDNKLQELIICNDLSGRLDHCLALIQNLLEAHRSGIKASLVSQTQIMQILSGQVTMAYPVNTLLSLLSVSDQTEFIDSTGLAYPLNNLTLYNWQSRGISNVTTEPSQSVNIASGLALVIITL
jgi:thiamine pyrophosphokinase